MKIWVLLKKKKKKGGKYHVVYDNEKLYMITQKLL